MAIPGWGTAVGAIAHILDKFVPTRRQRIRDELQNLEKDLADALLNNDVERAAVVRKRMSDLRKKIGDLDE